MVLGPAVVAGTALAGLGTVGLVAALRRHRGQPGANWFLASLGCQATACLAYAAGLLVRQPVARFALEAVMWGGLAGLAVFFLAFALEYTGRSHLLGTWWYPGLVLVPAVVLALALTNPWHHLGWTGYHVAPTLGLTTVAYQLQPWTLAVGTVVVALPLVGSLLLFETVLSYGRLYRREAVAVGLSTLPPTAAVLAWLYGVGPEPALNLTFVAFLPHVALDAEAFVRSDMFDFHPATRRVGERAAIDDLPNPVLIVDDRARVVTLNPAAEAVLGVDKRTAQTAPLADVLGAALDPADPGDRVPLAVNGEQRTFAVDATALTDGAGRHVGHTLVFQDVTDAIRREQRLAVLNRVLRHNLRNEMTVVRGFAADAADVSESEAVTERLERALGAADDLVSLGERAREIERVMEGELTRRSVALSDLVASVRAEHPDADVTVDVPELSVETDPEVLDLALGALLDNAVEHAGEGIRVTAERDGDRVRIAVDDDGPGIHPDELAPLSTGEETALSHGSGLGLWLADWSARRLGGDLVVETGEDGTTATLSIPDG